MLKYKKGLKPLPEKMSDLFELAVNDAIVATKKGYKLDMTQWLSMNGECRVCMAGAVLRNRIVKQKCHVSSYHSFIENVAPAEQNKLIAIDYFRSGMTGGMEIDFPYRLPQNVRKFIRDNYDWELDGGRAPWAIYRKAIEMLRAQGL